MKKFSKKLLAIFLAVAMLASMMISLNVVSAEETFKTPVEMRVRDRKKVGRRLDYIFVSEGVRVLSYETSAEMRPSLGLYYSDHFPVFADIALPKR